MSKTIFKKGQIINADEFCVGVGCLIPFDCYSPAEDCFADCPSSNPEGLPIWDRDGYVTPIDDYHIMLKTVIIKTSVEVVK